MIKFGVMLVLLISMFPMLAGCNQANNIQINVPPSSPRYFEMDIDITRQSSRYEIMLEAAILKNTDRQVTLSVKAEDINTASASSVHAKSPVILEKEIYSGKMKPQDKVRFTVPLFQLSEGLYSIELQALTEEDQYGRWGNLRVLQFRVDADGRVDIKHETDVLH